MSNLTRAAAGAALAGMAAILTVGLAPSACAEPKPAPKPLTIANLDAKSWVIADADSGAVLAEHNAHRQLPPASTLKVLTAYTLLPRLKSKSTYVGRAEDAKMAGNAVGINPGSTYKIYDLFGGLLLASANDAAMSLANAAGGKSVVTAAMNAEAARLQATDTVAKGPSGLDEPGQVTSAFDLVTVFRAAIENSDFRELMKLKRTRFPGPKASGSNERDQTDIWSLNPLLLEGYPGLIGGKTGYTTKAGRTYVAAAHRNGHTILISAMDYQQTTTETAKTLFEWGFANADSAATIELLPGSTTEDGPSTKADDATQRNAASTGTAHGSSALSVGEAATATVAGPNLLDTVLGSVGPAALALAILLLLVALVVASLILE